ncbi:MAG: ATP-binding protein [Leptothrix sp. (in: b-proteobacteria)]
MSGPVLQTGAALALIWAGSSLARHWPLSGPLATGLVITALLLMLLQHRLLQPAAAAGSVMHDTATMPASHGAAPPAPGAAAPGDAVGPVLLRLSEALPGPALLVRRTSQDAPWQLAYLNSPARQQARISWSGAPTLTSWLPQIADWPHQAMLQALERPQDQADSSADLAQRPVHVLPVDLLRAILWLPALPMTVPAALAAAHEHDSVIYTVSHDLRAPIRVIEGFTRIVREDYGAGLDRIGNDHLERILGAAARMNSMIDTILALARLSSQPITRQPVNLTLMARQVLDELQRQAPERLMDAQVAPGLTAQGDPVLLRMVLDNLLGNAWKYTARCASARIEFGSTPGPDGRPVYLVRDNGAGFDMRFAKRLFQPFQRLHSASEFTGSGVGLASVRRIIERHGGTIQAEAEVDKGAAFRFTLG